MNFHQKAAQFLLRLVAAGAMTVGGLLLGLEWLDHRAHGGGFHFRKIVLNALVFLAGVVLLAVSRRLAASLAGETDDEESTGE